MKNRIITMEGLVEYCKSQKTFSFNANEAGHPLIVSTYGQAEYSTDDDEGLMPVFLKACHTGLNKNGSYISKESMTNALPSFANKPILAEIVEDSKGNLDFGVHAMVKVEDENGEKKEYYIEQPVGIVPESNEARLEFDEETGNDYVYAKGFVFTFYGNETADILKRRKGTDVSIEIEINKMAWDAKNKWLSIDDFYFNGITFLGADYRPGMANARCELSDFSSYESKDYSKEINEMKSRLEFLEARFMNKDSKEGGKAQIMGKFNELLQRYGKTVEDITFDYSELSDEELEAKFAEMFDEEPPSGEEGSEEGSGEGSEEGGADTSESTDTSEAGSESSSTDTSESESTSSSSESSETADGGESTIPLGSKADDDEVAGTNTKKKGNYDLSLQEKINALTNLVCATYEDADNEWYGVLVYDSYVVMIGYFKGQSYKQSYTSENDQYMLVGDRVQVYEQFLTQEEIDALENMKKDFAALQEFKATVEKENFESQVNELVSDTRFDSIRDTEEFKAVLAEAEKYSLEELETQFKLIFADIELANRNFEQKPISQQKSGKMFRLPSKGGNPVESKYGGIFSE